MAKISPSCAGLYWHKIRCAWEIFVMPLTALAAKQIFTPLEAIENGLLVVEDGTIQSLGSREQCSVPPAARLVDLGDRILAPGFVDVHIHGARTMGVSRHPRKRRK